MKIAMISLAAGILLFVGSHDLFAYTYTYHNKTGFPVRITIRLYDDADKVGEIVSGGSHQISTQSLLRNWSVEAFVENEWQHVLDLNCDMLPGDHGFSVYVDEEKDSVGEVVRSWRVGYE